MIIKNNIATYSLLTIITNIGKRSFENMGKLIKKSGDTVSRMLRPGAENLKECQRIAQEVFIHKKELLVTIDETSIKKIYSQLMEGTRWLFDTKVGRSFNAYKLLVGAITDGKFTIPINAAFTFGKEFYEDPPKALQVTVQLFITIAQQLFPNAKIIAVLDGAFATVEFFKWAIESKIQVELRMHSNRTVEFKGKKMKLRDIKEIRPRGRQMARTVQVIWRGLTLYVTTVRRIDKHGNETIVYQASTYSAIPSKHAKNYKNRWGIEKFIRTSKQSLGLEECFSRKIRTQYDHICSVLLAYSIAQLERKRKGYKNPEEAIKALKKKNLNFLNNKYYRLDPSIDIAYA